ncbi:MAG: hypothetical protein JW973_16140 [Bacteroidales bacterium]|nr:hypothetical protein [Bacteroidales bacterium]
MKGFRIPVIGLLIFLVTGCQDVVDFYIGVPLQPSVDESGFIPGLNIFGIIRPDSTDAINNSFIMLQKVIPAVGSSDSLDVGTALVRVEKTGVIAVTYDFMLTRYDTVFRQEAYRPDDDFSPQAGDVFLVECTYTGLPVLTAGTIVPNAPEIMMNTVVQTGNTLTFEIQPDTSIYMLDIYVYADGMEAGYQRIPGNQTAGTPVTFSSFHGYADSIDIFGYDNNLAVYCMTSNTSLNFNKYRESFSTVENGYGVFGALNHTRVYLK